MNKCVHWTREADSSYYGFATFHDDSEMLQYFQSGEQVKQSNTTTKTSL